MCIRDRHRGVVAGTVVQQEESSAPKSRAIGFYDSEDRRNRNCRIKCVTAGIEDFETGFRCGWMCGRKGVSGRVGINPRGVAGQAKQEEQQRRPFHGSALGSDRSFCGRAYACRSFEISICSISLGTK